MPKNNILSARPWSWYARAALRQATSKEQITEVALAALEELEYRNQQIRDLGAVPSRIYNPRELFSEVEAIEESHNRQLSLPINNSQNFKVM